MQLVDTDVLVDVLRKHPPALTWLAALGSETLGMSGLVAMELLQGCRNRAEQRQVEKLWRPYHLYWPSQADCLRAYDDFAGHHLSHDPGIPDAVIAETAVGLGVKLATFNEGHYRSVAYLRLTQPYER
ncbi:MAG: VapC toxin family PIN domain ribonuclease [Chloroflexi bacterium HGW-Chloroflexi-1]|nr:MAG: VapC toxin family PIN domain ribonuclease [Chloroflexi bacterium HGW-Chloroflexi-1]